MNTKSCISDIKVGMYFPKGTAVNEKFIKTCKLINFQLML